MRAHDRQPPQGRRRKRVTKKKRPATKAGPRPKVSKAFPTSTADAASPKHPRRKRPKGATHRRIASVGLSQIYAHTRYSLAHGLDLDPDAVVFAIAMMLGSGGPPTSYWLSTGSFNGMGSTCRT